MRAALSLIILCFLIPCIVTAQEEIIPSVNIGDPSPPLQIREWLKGKPIRHFEKGKIYVMEFWATWCKPCKAAMPRLSTLARKYRDSVTIVGIDVYESLKTSLGMIKNFVDSMGSSMDYLVAAEDSNFMVEGWLSATDEKGNGIPRTFVVDRNGRLAWIGHPSALEMVLPDIIENRWDIQQALANRNLERHLKYLDKEAYYDLYNYLEKPDSILKKIDELVKREPGLKYFPFVSYYTFSALLETNIQKAIDYGNEIVSSPAYLPDAIDAIVDDIRTQSDELKLPSEIYRLGTVAYQIKIDHIPYPEIVDLHKMYARKSVWYWRAYDKANAIADMQKAIELLKGKMKYSPNDLAKLEDRLQQYHIRRPEDGDFTP